MGEDEEADPRPNKQPRCPICKRLGDQHYRPFCSRRCADLDLARWLGGNYAVAGHADAEEDGSLPPGAAGDEQKLH